MSTTGAAADTVVSPVTSTLSSETIPKAKAILSTSTVETVQKITQSVSSTVKSIIQQTTASVPPSNKVETAHGESPVDISQRDGKIFTYDASQLYEDDSHVFVYFIVGMLICAIGYVMFHNKRKILALIIEGRQQHGEVRRGAGGVNYKRLNTEPSVA